MVNLPARPHGIVVNGSAQRGWGSGWPRCQKSKQKTIRLKSGLAVEVRREISDLVKLLLDECERRGYHIIKDRIGGNVCRQIFRPDGTPTNQPSNHSWGLAIDLNWDQNPFQSTLKTNIPPWMISLMWAYGFFWGGWYNGDKDPMHFEFVRTPARAQALTLALRKALGAPAPVIGDNMFDPYLVQVVGKPQVFIVTVDRVTHVKNPTHLKFLIKGGVSETITHVTEAELAQLLVEE